MVSTHTGEELYSVSGDGYSVDVRPAFDPMDIVINSGLSLLDLRDITLARAEEEEAREIVLRIPRSEKPKSQLIELTRGRQGELEFTARTNSNLAASGRRRFHRADCQKFELLASEFFTMKDCGSISRLFNTLFLVCTWSQDCRQ
jgi:hypothetical protein